MSRARGPLDRQSILVIDDDMLAAFRVRQHLVAAGARVIMGDARETLAYLAAPALAAVVVGAGVNVTDLKDLLIALDACPAPWVAYGPGADTSAFAAAGAQISSDLNLLVETLAAFLAPNRH